MSSHRKAHLVLSFVIVLGFFIFYFSSDVFSEYKFNTHTTKFNLSDQRGEYPIEAFRFPEKEVEVNLDTSIIVEEVEMEEVEVEEDDDLGININLTAELLPFQFPNPEPIVRMETESEAECWEGRVKPSIFIIGVQKGGTTALTNMLKHHPSIKFGKCSPPMKNTTKDFCSDKEIHFFSSNMRYNGLGMEWYCERYPMKDMFEHEVVSIDATPNYMITHEVAERMVKFDKDAKFVVLLRDPVSRAYSEYQMFIQNPKQYKEGISDKTFAQMIDKEYNDFQRCKASFETLKNKEDLPPGSLLQHCLSNRFTTFPHTLVQGLYYEILVHWFRYFPRESFIIMPSDDLSQIKSLQDPLMANILERLGLAPFPDEISASLTSNSRSYPPEDPLVKQALQEFYEPYNQQLFDLLGWDAIWNYNATDL